MTIKLYAERNLEALGFYYVNHIDAMTGEQLHSKSDIAAELAVRDRTIDQLRAERDRLYVAAKRMYDANVALCGCDPDACEAHRLLGEALAAGGSE